jgi:hypothetical protein
MTLPPAPYQLETRGLVLGHLADQVRRQRLLDAQRVPAVA